MCLALSILDSNLSHLIQQSYNLDLNFQHLLTELQSGAVIPHFSLKDGLIRRKSKLLVGPDQDLKMAILNWLRPLSERCNTEKGESLVLLERP